MPARSIWKWVRRVLLALIVLAIVAVLIVWAGSERVLRKSYTEFSAATPSVHGDAEAGKHWAAILGCTDCHDPTLHGMIIDDESFWLGTLVAPNLTVKRRLYDDAAFARVIRHGVKQDGHGVDLMPSNVFYHADDQIVADVIAFLRAAPDSERALPEKSYGPIARWNFFTGAWQAVPDQFDHTAARIGDQPHASGLDRGRYIATLACGECHGLDQRGDPDAGVPNLAVAKAYSLEEFTSLMRKGIAKGNRPIRKMMSATAQRRFAAFSDDEIATLKAFLDARAP